jgi:hypothetical protein
MRRLAFLLVLGLALFGGQANAAKDRPVYTAMFANTASLSCVGLEAFGGAISVDTTILKNGVHDQGRQIDVRLDYSVRVTVGSYVGETRVKVRERVPEGTAEVVLQVTVPLVGEGGSTATLTGPQRLQLYTSQGSHYEVFLTSGDPDWTCA